MAGEGRTHNMCVHFWFSPPAPPFQCWIRRCHFGMSSLYACHCLVAKAAVISNIEMGGRGGRQGQIAKLEPHYIDSTEKGSSHTPLTDTGAAQQLASQPLKCKIAHSRFLLPGMDTNKWSSPH